MLGHSFDGQAVENTTPMGGTVTVAIGHITPEEGADPIQAVYTKIVGPDGVVTADYGLTSGSFGTYMETLKTAFDRYVPAPAEIETPSNDLAEQSLVYRLRKRAEIRRQIPGRKSVENGEPDRIADLLDEAATALEKAATPYNPQTIDDDVFISHHSDDEVSQSANPMAKLEDYFISLPVSHDGDDEA